MMIEVKNMKSPLVYVGGKSILSKQIVKMIPDHDTYCEVFCGAGWVFFAKPQSRYEVINDLDSDLIDFYRVIQNHLEEFLKQFKWLLTSREWFDDWNNQLQGRGLTDIQRAARYYYVQRLAFGGRVHGRTYGVTHERPPRINLLRLEEELSDIHLRLARVSIENLSWDKFVIRYDRPGTFFYLDPPYYQSPCYKHNFYTIEDYIKIRDVMGSIKSSFMLSINDHPEIREVFKGLFIRPVTLNYSISKEKSTEGKELIITNYQIE